MEYADPSRGKFGNLMRSQMWVRLPHKLPAKSDPTFKEVARLNFCGLSFEIPVLLILSGSYDDFFSLRSLLL
jgi:hypothetical protein